MNELFQQVQEQDKTIKDLQAKLDQGKKAEFKMEQPAKFSGKKEDVQSFTTALRAYHQHYNAQFPYRGDSVRFAASRLEGEPGTGSNLNCGSGSRKRTTIGRRGSRRPSPR